MEANEKLWNTREVHLDNQSNVQGNDLQSSTRREDHILTEVKTCVRQGCTLSPFLFLMTIDGTINRRIENGLQWTLWEQLDAARSLV